MNCNIWFHRCINPLASIAITATLAMLCVPRDGCCVDETIESLAKDILVEMEAGNFESLPGKFKEVERFFETSDDPIAEGRKLFKAFINEANAHYGLSLTVSQACQLIKDRLLLRVPLESQESLLLAIELLCAEGSAQERGEKSEP